MLASRIMNRRTTVSAPAEALDTIEREAAARGVALTVVLAEAVQEKAAAIRAGRRPRVGGARSGDGLAAADVASKPVARPPG